MTVYLLYDSWDDNAEWEPMMGDTLLDIYDSYDKAYVAAMDYRPHSIAERESDPVEITENPTDWGVRSIEERSSHYHYSHELYIQEMEVK